MPQATCCFQEVNRVFSTALGKRRSRAGSQDRVI
jgi:hypothetical protein